MDGTTHSGMFQSNLLHCENGVICYPNGDVYKGGVHQGKKHCAKGEYAYGSGEDTYIGPFAYDCRDTFHYDNQTLGELHFKSLNDFKYKGWFKGDSLRGNF
mmetsp:Transcript_9794/g.16493  ORF Transcript_9794/g.16493 Transcript_9794/m.16493 type:complete len:101 (-) Transcript_9794:359-661(-)